MLIRFFVAVLIFSGTQQYAQIEAASPTTEKPSKYTDVLPEEMKRLEFGPFRLQAEDLKIRVKRDTYVEIELSGNARLLCGKTRITARNIKVSYKDHHNLSFSLNGDVEIENEQEQIRMYARSAHLYTVERKWAVDNQKKNIRLHCMSLSSLNRGRVKLVRTQDQQTTQIEAGKISVAFQNRDTMWIRPEENVTISERPARPSDRILFENAPRSEFDFFNSISITGVKIISEDWAVKAPKPFQLF